MNLLLVDITPKITPISILLTSAFPYLMADWLLQLLFICI